MKDKKQITVPFDCEMWDVTIAGKNDDITKICLSGSKINLYERDNPYLSDLVAKCIIEQVVKHLDNAKEENIKLKEAA